MSNYKRSFKAYPAWNYQEEIDDLNKASEQGWQLVRGGCFHNTFVKNPEIRYRYQLDYRRIEDMGRYIETFREQGWEYVNSTFNGWHYFRKLYDPALPEEDFEIFTDSESMMEMNRRWALLAGIIGAVIGIIAGIFTVRAVLQPQLPLIIITLTLAFECAVLLWGSLRMRNPKASRRGRGGSTFLAVFLAVIILGSASFLILTDMRPHYMTDQRADSIAEPVRENTWMKVDVRYADNYYLDLDMESDEPMTFAVVADSGETVFTVTDTAVRKDNIRLKLTKGTYWFSLSCDAGFRITCEID